MAVSPIGDGGNDYSTGPWSKQNDDIVKQYIQDALNRHGGDVGAAAEDLRLRRNDPQNFYDTNMAMAEDYLFARSDSKGNGTIGENAKINTYMALKQVNSCLYGCFSRPQAVVYWGAAAALSQNLEGIPVEVCDRGGLPRVLGCVPLAGRFRMPALWEPTRLRTKASALAMFPMSAADVADGRYHPA